MGFKTALMGFNKQDVLACIDRMSAESLEQQRQAEERAAALQDELGQLRSDKYALQGQLEESRQQTVREGERADEAENRATALSEQVANLTRRADDYKKRLFTREEEAVVLRRDNTRLTQTLSEKQQELAQMLDELNAVKQACETEIGRMKQEAADLAARAAAEAESRVQTAQQAAAQAVEQAQAQARADVDAALDNADQLVCKARLQAKEQAQAAEARAAETEAAAWQAVQKARREADESVQQMERQVADADARALTAQQTAEQQVQAAQQAADRRAAAAEAAAEARLAAGQAELDAQAAAAQTQMADSAALIAQNLAVVKRDLAAVDARILEVTAELQRSTQALAAALAQAEQGIEALGGKMSSFPAVPAEPAAPAPKAAPVKAAAPKAAPAAGVENAFKGAAKTVVTTPVRVKSRRGGVADLLLDKLSKMLGE